MSRVYRNDWSVERPTICKEAAMPLIEGENMRGVRWVVIDEVKSGDWPMGGQSVSAGKVRSPRTGVPA
jgi:4-oxalocrotonate tautomerase